MRVRTGAVHAEAMARRLASTVATQKVKADRVAPRLSSSPPIGFVTKVDSVTAPPCPFMFGASPLARLLWPLLTAVRSRYGSLRDALCAPSVRRLVRSRSAGSRRCAWALLSQFGPSGGSPITPVRRLRSIRTDPLSRAAVILACLFHKAELLLTSRSHLHSAQPAKGKSAPLPSTLRNFAPFAPVNIPVKRLTLSIRRWRDQSSLFGHRRRSDVDQRHQMEQVAWSVVGQGGETMFLVSNVATAHLPRRPDVLFNHRRWCYWEAGLAGQALGQTYSSTNMADRLVRTTSGENNRRPG